MLKNYVKIALRNLLRHKGHTLINVAGLAVGLACCLLIFQYVAFEYSFDRFHENRQNLYRVIQSTPLVQEAFEPLGAFTGYALQPALTGAVPEIRHAVRLHGDNAIVTSPLNPDRVFEEDRVLYADPAFLDMFTFPLIAGHEGRLLEPGTMLLSESAARKYFGSANPIGQVLDVTGDIEKSFRVTGVFRDVPPNSHLQFDFLLPMHDLLQGERYRNEPEGGWSWNNFATYVQLHPGADPATAEQKMTDVYTIHRGEALEQMGRKARLFLQPLRDIHLNADVIGPIEIATGSYRTVYFFTVIGLVTLLIALVNYINLATARALERAREVGVRKVIGAQRRQLVSQFLFESGLTNLVAALLAVVLAMQLTPVMNHLAGTQLTGALWVSPTFWAVFLVTLALCTLLAGLYPAFVLSSFKPVTVLKGKTGSFSGKLWLRRGLVMFQFAASVVLVGGTAIVYEQLQYMRRMDLELDLEQVLTVDGPRVLPEGTDYTTAMATFVQELRRLPALRQLATSTTVPGQGFNWYGASTRRAEADPSNTIRGVVTYIDTSFADVYGLELLAGRGFADISDRDPEEGPWPVLANETAIRTLGFDSPTDAVGAALDIGGYEARVLGVFKDFNWTSAHEPRQNIFFGYTSEGDEVSLRVTTNDLPGTIARIEAIYDRLFPGNVFHYAFVDELFDQQYRNEERFAALFTLFAALAIGIACLGLLGLAAFTTQQRTKEIGVRKVLGASTGSIVALLSKDYALLVLGAFVIASPVAYVFMRQWLNNFAYHVEIGPDVFLLAGGLPLLLALLTVSYQAVKAALTDPVKSLRYE